MMRKAPVWAVVAALLSVTAVLGMALPNAMTSAAGLRQGVNSDAAVSAINPRSEPVWRTGGPTGGVAQALALSPGFAEDGLAFAGGWRTGLHGPTDGYGIRRTTDRGAAWEALFSSPPWSQLMVMDLAISPGFDSDGTVFAATDAGVLRTANRGNTWEHLHGGLPEAGNDPQADDTERVLLSPAFQTDGTLLGLLTNGGLFLSTDRGNTWSGILTGSVEAATFSRSYGANRSLFAAVPGPNPHSTSVMRSTDRGATWGAVQTLAANSAADVIETTEGALLIATPGGVVRLSATVGGYLLDAVAPNVGGAVNRLAIAGDHIYAAAESGLFITLSDGRRWGRYADTPAIPFRSVAPCPQWGRCHALLSGTYQGILGTADDNLEPWEWLGGVRRLASASVAASPAFAGDATLFVGTDHGLFRSSDGGASWRLLTPGRRPDHTTLFSQVRVSTSYAVDAAVFAAYEDRVSGERALYLSTDRGATWEVKSGPFDSGERMALAVSPAYRLDRTLFVAQGDLLRKSTDGGATWQPRALAPPGAYFSTLEVEASPAYAVDRTLFATGWGGVRRSTDGGATWRDTGAHAPAYGLAISPGYATDRTLWHSFRAIEGAGDGTPDSGIRRSTDGGQTWHWATAGLPGVYEPFPIPLAPSRGYTTDNSLFAALSGPLAAGIDHRLYRSLDRGGTWQDLGPAPGNPNPLDLAVTVDGLGRQTVHLATEDGLWQYARQCDERLVNGGFEIDAAWELPITPYRAAYSDLLAHTERRSLRTGIPSGADVYSYSTGKQSVTIPASVQSAVLDFWWYPISAEPPATTADRAEPPPAVLDALAQGILPEGLLAGDWQYALLLAPDGSIIPNSPRLWTRSNARTWQHTSLDLTAYRGRSLTIVFGTLNDGDGRSTAMYVDDVALTACWPPLPTPTPHPTASPTPTTMRRHDVFVPLNLYPHGEPPTATPTATITPTPTATPTTTPTLTHTPTPTTTVTPGPACYERIVNGGFEASDGWILRSNPVLAQYVTAPVHAGTRSMRTGIGAGGTNVVSYSPIEQALTFPPLPSPGISSTIRLSFWHYNVYGEGAAPSSRRPTPDLTALPRTEDELKTQPLAADLFYVIAIRDDGTIDWLFTEAVHNPSWRQTSVDISRYAGQHIRLQFGTYNDGVDGISRTFVDDVSVQVCPPQGAFVLPSGWVRRVIGRPEASTLYADVDGALFRSTDAGRTWLPAGRARPEHTILSSDPDVLYAGDGYPCYQGGDPAPMWRTTDGGASWHVLTAGRNLKPLAAHALDRRLYAAGCDGPYLSADAGTSFDHQADPLFGLYDAKSIAPVSPGWDDVWIAGVSEGGGGGVLVSRNGGTTWALAFPRPGDGEIGWLGQIALDRYLPGRVYVPAYEGFFYTPDDGGSWLENSQGLEDVTGGVRPSGLYALAQDPGEATHRLYLGTQRGLYARDGATHFWYKLAGQPFDTLAVVDLLVLDGLPSRLYATTSYGVFLYDLGHVPAPPPTPTPTATWTPTGTPTPTATATPSLTPSPTATPTATPTPTASAIPTAPPGTWATPSVIGTLALPAGSHPHGIALNAGGDRAYIAFHGADHGGRTLGVIDTAALSLLAQIPVSAGPSGPNGVAFMPRSNRVVVTNRQTANASVVDPGAISGGITQISAGEMPDGVAVHGSFGYIANFGSNTVTVFDPATLIVSATLPVGGEPSLFAVDPTAGDIYLSLHGSNQVQRLRDGVVTAVYDGIAAPYGLAVDPIGRRLYVADRGFAHSVTVIDTATGAILGTIALDREPFVLAVNPRTGHLHVACGDQVKIFRTLDWAPVATIPVPVGAEEGITVDEARNIVYVTSREGDALTAIQDTAPPWVLFGSDRSGRGDLYRMLPDGREQMRLTFTEDASESQPAGSPDGRWIAYVRLGADGRQHIWLMSRDGHGAHQVTSGAWDDLRPSWSGDAAQVAFASNRSGNWEIYTQRLADGGLTRLTYDAAEDTNPDWSWATGRLAFQSNRNGPNPEIFSMSAAGDDVRQLTINYNGDRGPTWSPGGDYIVFWSSRGEQTLYKMRADGSGVVPMVSRLLRPESASWGEGSAGNWIIFSGYRPDSGYSEIFRMTSWSTDLVLLTQNELNFDFAPGWLPGQ